MAPENSKIKKPRLKTRTRRRIQIAFKWGLTGPDSSRVLLHLIHVAAASLRKKLQYTLVESTGLPHCPHLQMKKGGPRGLRKGSTPHN